VQREILLAQRRDKPIYPMLLQGEEFPLLIDIQFVDVRTGQMPDKDFYARLESVLQPADESGQMVAPEEPPPSEPEMSQTQSSDAMPRGLLAIGAVLVVAVIAALAGILLLGGGDDDSEPTQIGVSEALSTLGGASTETPTSTPTNAPVPVNTQVEVALGFTPVTSNTEWTPHIEAFDGVEMVLVPVGCFMMGSEDGDEDERPVHEQCFDEPFWIDRTEVTNEQYGAAPEIDYCLDFSLEPDQPRNCVTWFEAVAHCESRNARLPTEREWEYAARGPDNLVYPWGDTYDAALVIGEDDPTYGDIQSAPAGSRPDGMSWVGAMDLSGDLYEWTSTIYDPFPYDLSDGRENTDNGNSNRVLRGGSFLNSRSGLRAVNRLSTNPIDFRFDIGFRCARDY
jgi:formylglycine-generating enzyme required for sulfatase activity